MSCSTHLNYIKIERVSHLGHFFPINSDALIGVCQVCTLLPIYNQITVLFIFLLPSLYFSLLPLLYPLWSSTPSWSLLSLFQFFIFTHFKPSSCPLRLCSVLLWLVTSFVSLVAVGSSSKRRDRDTEIMRADCQRADHSLSDACLCRSNL